MEENVIYLDHAATTAVYPEVVEAMLPYFSEKYGNPSSVYRIGSQNKDVISVCRAQIAEALDASPEEIFFTSGGTESDNWAVKMTADAMAGKGRHIITSAFEHHAVLYPCQWLEKHGWEVTYLQPDERGLIAPEAVEEAIRPDTVLISIMYANNEIGTVQQAAKIGQIARKHEILFHTDAVQAFGHLPLSVKDVPADMLSASAHKFGGPKGIGFLYVRKGVRLPSFMHGGAQERKKRAGTENVPGIVGMAKACEISMQNREEKAERVRAMRDHLIRRVLAEIPEVRLNGDPERRLPGNASFSFGYLEGQSLLILMDMDGICCSGGSACSSGSLEPSHVLKAIGVPRALAKGSLRMTLGADNTEEEIDRAADILKKNVGKLRSMSPAWQEYQERR